MVDPLGHSGLHPAQLVDCAYRIDRVAKSLFFKMRHLAARLGRDGEPGPAEVRDRIAEALNVKVKDVEGMEARLTKPINR